LAPLALKVLEIEHCASFQVFSTPVNYSTSLYAAVLIAVVLAKSPNSQVRHAAVAAVRVACYLCSPRLWSVDNETVVVVAAAVVVVVVAAVVAAVDEDSILVAVFAVAGYSFPLCYELVELVGFVEFQE